MKKPPRIGATSYTLLLVLLVYLALVALFAFKTPPWQNPDEPAHYNYVAYLATEGKLPVLQMGDYDGAYLERLKAEKFPPALSIDPVRYEFHQPPLYYLLAAPVYWLSGGSLLALRLFSAVLGAGGRAAHLPLRTHRSSRLAAHRAGRGRVHRLPPHAHRRDGVGQQRRAG